MTTVTALLAGLFTTGFTVAAPSADAAVSPSQQWATAASAPTPAGNQVGATRTATFGTSGVTAVERTTAIVGNCTMNNSGQTFTGANLTSFVSPTPPAQAGVFSSGCAGVAPGSSRTSTLTFNKPVLAPVFHVANLDASQMRVTGTSTTGAAVSLVRVAGNNALEVANNVINTGLSFPAAAGCETNAGANASGACGSVRVNTGSGAIQTLTLQNLTNPAVMPNSDGWYYSLSYPTAPLTKAFSPASILPGGTSQLTFTVANPANEAQPTLSGMSFSDALPSGLTIANGTVTNNGSCGAPTVRGPGNAALAAGATSLTAAGVTVAAGATCTITVNVTASGVGSYVNNNANLTTTVANLVPNANTTLTVGVPAVTCTSDPDIFNTGYNAATGGFLPNNAKDAGWQVAGRFAPSQGASMPPAGATWSSANVGKLAGPWLNSPYGNAQWISQQSIANPSQGGVTGDWYYRYQFALDGAVDPAAFALAMNFYADNNVAEVFVNGEAQSTKTTGLPQFPLGPWSDAPPSGPYYTPGFVAGNEASTVLNSDWQTGLNTIIVQIKSGPDAQGFLAQMRPSALCPEPSIAVEKTASPATAGGAGDEITYSFLVTNTGNVTLTDITVNEGVFTGSGELSEVVCPAGAASLAAGATVTCTATYVLTQADVDAGSVTNSATVSGTPPSGDPVDSPPSEVTIEVPPAPGISVVKSASPMTSEEFVVGQEIDYSFVVTNTGNVTLADVTVDEGAFTGSGELSEIVCAEGAASLAPGAQVTCTATYELTQADVDAGSVTNSATATGGFPGGPPPQSPPSEVTIPTPPVPGITVEKTATPSTAGEAGDEITYSFLVTNTGNVTLTDIAIDEGEFTGTGELSEIVCPAASASLLPGAQVTCEATYTLTQADIDAGSVTNSATATGDVPGGGTPPVSPPSEVTIELPPAPAISVEKTATPETADAAGHVITYAFEITNTGNVTLTDVTVDEGTFTGTGELSDIVCPEGAASLAPGDSVTCVATYELTQADVDAGSVTNTATATGTPPNGGTPPVSPPSEVTIELPPAPGVSVVKSADGDEFAVGEEVTYSFVITNTGNVTLSDVTVDEGEFTGTGELSPVECAEGAASLAPGAQVTCTATYTLTQADIDAGSITNTATATGDVPDGGTPPVSPPSEVVFPTPQAPELALVKTSDADGLTGAGQAIGYSFEVTNTGNVTMSDITVDEGTFTGTGELSAIDCPVTTLLPGETVTCAATYEVTQADVDAGELSNTATASGVSPSGEARTVSNESTRDLPFVGASGLELEKSSTVEDVNGNRVTDPGDRIRWSFTVTNIGGTTITGIVIDDPAAGAVTCQTTILLPGASMVCAADNPRVITEADVAAGSVVNTATVSGTGPDGSTITSGEATASVSVVATPSPLAITGGTIAIGVVIFAIAAIILGAILLVVRRRENAEELIG